MGRRESFWRGVSETAAQAEGIVRWKLKQWRAAAVVPVKWIAERLQMGRHRGKITFCIANGKWPQKGKQYDNIKN
jgi:hypothetical protein